jgi:hypothetical protein
MGAEHACANGQLGLTQKNLRSKLTQAFGHALPATDEKIPA